MFDRYNLEKGSIVKEIERNCLEKLLATIEFEKGIRSKKELHIIEENIAGSTLDIWGEKNIPHPKLTQYEIYKCFILRYELAFSGFINPIVDLYHYTLKDIVYYDKIMEVTEDNIDQCFERGKLIDKKCYLQMQTYVL